MSTILFAPLETVDGALHAQVPVVAGSFGILTDTGEVNATVYSSADALLGVYGLLYDGPAEGRLFSSASALLTAYALFDGTTTYPPGTPPDPPPPPPEAHVAGTTYVALSTLLGMQAQLEHGSLLPPGDLAPPLPTTVNGALFTGVELGLSSFDVDSYALGFEVTQQAVLASDLDTAFAEGGLLLDVDATLTSGQGAVIAIATAPPFLQIVSGWSHTALRDEAVFGDSVDVRTTVVLRAMYLLADGLHGRSETRVSLSDDMALSDAMQTIFHELMAVSAQFGDGLEIDHTALVQMHDALLLSGACTTTLEARAVLVEAVAFGAMLSAAEMLTLADEVAYADEIRQSYHGAAVLVDQLLASDTLAASARFAVLLSDDMVASIAQQVTLDARALLRDAVAFVAHLELNDGRYVAWCMNTKTRAQTTFSQWPFNSYVRIRGKTHGVADDGLYLIGGDNDDGAAIHARIRLGMSALGTDRQKRTPEVYLGYTATDDLLFKVVYPSTEDGQREGYEYVLRATNAVSMREGRVKLGRGLKSAYFDYEVENVDGGDFEIDWIKVHVLPLDRRLRGNAGGM